MDGFVELKKSKKQVPKGRHSLVHFIGLPKGFDKEKILSGLLPLGYDS